MTVKGKNPQFYPNHLTSFGTLPFFFAGLQDSTNPCALTTLVIFAIFIFYFGDTRRKIFWLGLGFILATFNTWLAIIMGRFDQILVLPAVSQILKVIYLTIAMVFIALAYLNLKDWWSFLKTKDIHSMKIKLPLTVERLYNYSKTKIVNPLPSAKKTSKMKMFFSAYIAGFLLTFLGSMWPPHQNVLLILYSFGLQGNLSEALFITALYGLAFVLPLIIAFILLWRFGGVPGIVSNGDRLISRIKIISSAVLLSMGLGIIYIFVIRYPTTI